MSDLIDRNELLKVLEERKKPNNGGEDGTKERYRYMQWLTDYNAVKEAPPAQPERDIPRKPIETTDRAWGIPSRQAVCPKCDYYLGHIAFLGDYKGKRITYCETCGQAIDWEGWEFDE